MNKKPLVQQYHPIPIVNWYGILQNLNDDLEVMQSQGSMNTTKIVRTKVSDFPEKKSYYWR
jgi:hypothetical protein